MTNDQKYAEELKRFSRGQLMDTKESIDREEFPERYDAILKEIENRPLQVVTHRERINKRLFVGMCLFWGGMGFGVMCLVLGSFLKVKASGFLFAVCGFLAVVGLNSVLLSIRCPNCMKRLGLTFPSRGMGFLGEEYNCCPFCGFNLNQGVDQFSKRN